MICFFTTAFLYQSEFLFFVSVRSLDSEVCCTLKTKNFGLKYFGQSIFGQKISDEFSPYFGQYLETFRTNIKAINNAKILNLRHVS